MNVQPILIAPEHLRGSMHGSMRHLIAERTRWVQEQIERGHSQATIARALGIDRGRITDISGIVDRSGADNISLVPTPWNADGERPAIRQTLVKPATRPRGATVSEVIAIIRAEYVKATVHAGERA